MDSVTRRDFLGRTSAAAVGASLVAAGAWPTSSTAAEAGRAMLRFAQAEIVAAAQATRLAPPPVRFATDRALGEQAYRIERNGANGFVVTGGDEAGAMYGGLDLAEALRLGPAAMARATAPRVHRPRVLRRGIKFNVPLDLRTPSYGDGSTSAQLNLPEVWTHAFWAQTFDELARHRYNTMSLWNLHPFPSLVKVPEFPDVALDDVWRSTHPLSPIPRNLAGRDAVPPEFLAEHEVVRRMPIQQKIAFWREVMQMAADRGIDVYLVTWNVFTYGTNGKYGIDDRMENPATVAYMRASVRETIRTYPLLKGIGITAGENMPTPSAAAKESWLWSTYGEGVRDALRAEPNRDFRLIHRFWQTSGDDIRKSWAKPPIWPDRFEFSFKYSWAHMYSDPKPRFVDTVMPLLKDTGMKTWLEVRNDDVLSLRWGDPDYVREYVENMPAADKLIGFFMGPDGFTWGRDFLDRDTAGQDLGPARRLVMQKHWYSFMLWGRLSYDPTLPDAHFVETFRARYPDADAPRLYAATAAASKIIPQMTRFFWHPEDLNWLPEADAHVARVPGTRDDYFGSRHYTVADLMSGLSMPNSNILNIRQWRYRKLNGRPMEATTPLQVADALAGFASETLRVVGELKFDPANLATKDLRQIVGDNEAMADLGLYYAEKIRGACDLALFDATAHEDDRRAALAHLEAALAAWKRYAAARDAQYLPNLFPRIGWIDLTAMTSQVAADLDLVRHWTPGQLKFDPNNPADQQIGETLRTV
ncbi:MAG: twin-arginine translocation signal domain-containing protein [Novosphingobium sp.]|nr:twin-arginine translocation signal domain-containing protein [Novosphingobium sp.]